MTIKEKTPPRWTPPVLKQARNNIAVTQKELADAIGTTQQRISEWETRTTPRSAWQRHLSAFFDAQKSASEV
jgi:DNA-binding transcriptional regulator YiaG